MRRSSGSKTKPEEIPLLKAISVVCVLRMTGSCCKYFPLLAKRLRLKEAAVRFVWLYRNVVLDEWSLSVPYNRRRTLDKKWKHSFLFGWIGRKRYDIDYSDISKVAAEWVSRCSSENGRVDFLSKFKIQTGKAMVQLLLPSYKTDLKRITNANLRDQIKEYLLNYRDEVQKFRLQLEQSKSNVNYSVPKPRSQQKTKKKKVSKQHGKQRRDILNSSVPKPTTQQKTKKKKKASKQHGKQWRDILRLSQLDHEETWCSLEEGSRSEISDFVAQSLIEEMTGRGELEPLYSVLDCVLSDSEEMDLEMDESNCGVVDNRQVTVQSPSSSEDLNLSTTLLDNNNVENHGDENNNTSTQEDLVSLDLSDINIEDTHMDCDDFDYNEIMTRYNNIDVICYPDLEGSNDDLK